MSPAHPHLKAPTLTPPCTNLLPTTGAADQHLLLAILTTQDVKVDFEVVAAQLGCTARAVQERLKKLKKMAAEHAGADPTAAAAAVVAPKTPTKSKTKAPAKTKGAAAGGAEDGTPSPKKRKIATPKSGKANGKGGSGGGVGVKEVGGRVEVKAEEIEAEIVGEEGVGGAGMEDGEGEVGEYGMGLSEMSQVKEEDLLDNGHDPVLYDAHIGLLSSEI